MPESNGSETIAGALARINSPQYDGLTTWDLIPLSFETRSAINLLKQGYRQLITQRPIEEHIDVFLTVISSGMEKLLKVALGHAALNDSSGWTIKSLTYGHRIRDMNRSLLRIAQKSEVATPETLALVTSIKTDPIVQALLDVMQQYATGGRFYYLDELEKRHSLSPGNGPFGSWIVLLLAISDLHPEFDSDEELDGHHRVLAESLRTWWGAVSLLATQGVFGRRAIKWGEEICPPGLEYV